MSKKKLSIEQKMFLIVSMACFDTPAQAHKAAKEIWPDFDVDRRLVSMYNVTTVGGRMFIGKDLQKLFHDTRARFIEDKMKIGMAHKAVRLRRLERYVNRLEDRNNLIGAMQALEQIAKEVGESFTNRHIHSGPDGGPLQHQILTDQERVAAVLDLFATVAIAQEKPQARPEPVEPQLPDPAATPPPEPPPGA